MWVLRSTGNQRVVVELVERKDGVERGELEGFYHSESRAILLRAGG